VGSTRTARTGRLRGREGARASVGSAPRASARLDEDTVRFELGDERVSGAIVALAPCCLALEQHRVDGLVGEGAVAVALARCGGEGAIHRVSG
jgi:hypothetical protein